MYRMQQSMRWYGPEDKVSLQDIRQAGCTHVVTALHQFAYGEIWTMEAIAIRKEIIESAGLKWTVVESLSVHEDIKKQQGKYIEYLENYKTSLKNLAQNGIKVITYNFMPILDWTRTSIAYQMPDGSNALYFEKLAFMAFDLFLLNRPNAINDYTQKEFKAAEIHFAAMSETEKKALYRDVMMGLPGAGGALTRDDILEKLDGYEHISETTLRKHLIEFLGEIVPVADKLGLKMAIHPDDPPWSVLGLPRVVSTESDLAYLLETVDNKTNGLCFCTGSLGSRADNNILGMLKKFGQRIHFLHLRNTRRDAFGNFHEADHLDGDTDMPGVVKEVVGIMQENGHSIPMRPDHGHQMLDDLKKDTYPGYTAIGRLRGLAEIRGLEEAFLYSIRE